jgi:hypothetical protein
VTAGMILDGHTARHDRLRAFWVAVGYPTCKNKRTKV